MSHHRSPPWPPAKPGPSSPSSLALQGMEQYGGPSGPPPRSRVNADKSLPPTPSNYMPPTSWRAAPSSLPRSHSEQSQQRMSLVRRAENSLPATISSAPPPHFLVPVGVLLEPAPMSFPHEERENPINTSLLVERTQIHKAEERVPTQLTMQPSFSVEYNTQPLLAPAHDDSFAGSPQFSGSLRNIVVEEEYGYGVTSELHGHQNITPTRENPAYRDPEMVPSFDIASPDNAPFPPDGSAQSLELINEALQEDPPPGEPTTSSSVYSGDSVDKIAEQLLPFRLLNGEDNVRLSAVPTNDQNSANDEYVAPDVQIVPQPLFSPDNRPSVSPRVRDISKGRPKRMSVRHVASKRASVVMRTSSGRYHVSALLKNGRRLRTSPPTRHDPSFETLTNTAQDVGPIPFRPQEYPASPSHVLQEPARFVTILEHSGPKSADHILGQKTRMSGNSSRLFSRTFGGFQLPTSRFSNRTSAGTATSFLRGTCKQQVQGIDEAGKPRTDKNRLMFAKATVDVAKKGVRDAWRRLSEAQARQKREKRGKEIKESIRYIAVVDPAKAKYEVNPPGGWM